jgi:hypothetical protein
MIIKGVGSSVRTEIKEKREENLMSWIDANLPK